MSEQSAERREPPKVTGTILLTLPRRGGSGKPDAELILTLDEHEGHPFLSLRLWTVGSDGNRYPTQKGTTIRVREVYEVIRALCDGARRMGVELHPRAEAPPDGAPRG